MVSLLPGYERSWVGHLLRCAVLLGVALLAGCKSELFSRLSEADANAVLEALYSEGVRAEKVTRDREFWSVEVAESDMPRALRITKERAVPHERFATMGELFKKEGLVSSPSEERLRYIFAVSQELSKTLTQIDGVITARVHPVIPANDPLADRVKPASASVFIKHHGQADVQQMAPAIRTLVARSIEGLSPDNVSLTFFAAAPSRITPAPTSSPLFVFWQQWSIEIAIGMLVLLAGVVAYLWRSKRQSSSDIEIAHVRPWRALWSKTASQREAGRPDLDEVVPRSKIL
jgi:type III secretion protein J